MYLFWSLVWFIPPIVYGVMVEHRRKRTRREFEQSWEQFMEELGITPPEDGHGPQ